MSEGSVKKICLGIIVVFFLMWIFLSDHREKEMMNDQYKQGYSEGYSEGYADALAEYGIEE